MNSIINIKITNPNTNQQLESALENMIIQQLIKKEEEKMKEYTYK